MDLLWIKKQHFRPITGHHQVSSNSYAVRVLYNYCKRALVLRSHHLRVLLDITYSTSMKSWYYPDTVYLHRWWALWVGWCLDSLCGGSIMGSLICHYPSVFGVNINRGAIPPVDVCVDVVHWLSMYGIIQCSPGPIQGVWVLPVV